MNNKIRNNILTTAIIILTLLYIFIVGFGTIMKMTLIYEETYSLMPIVILFLILLKVFFSKLKRAVKIISTIVYILASILIIGNMMLSHFFVDYPNNFYFESPYNHKIILVQEEVNISGLNIDAYKLKYFVYKESFNEDADVSYTDFGEPDTPLSGGNYKVRWSDSQFFLTVYSDGTSGEIVVSY